jgi:hypothetical protein
MAIGPIDYTSAFGQQGGPFGQVLQGLQAGSQFAAIEQQRAAQQAAIEAQRQKTAAEEAAMRRQQQINDAVAGLVANPNRTFADYERVAVLLPEKEAASLRANFEGLSKERQSSDLAFSGQVLAAFNSKAPQVGISLLRERAAGERNAGREQQARAFETWADIAERDPESASATIGTLVSVLPGGDKVIESVGKVQEQKRASQLAPFTLRKTTAEVIIKEAEANLAPKKFLADLNLTNAQIKQAEAAQAASRAAAAAAGAEARRKDAEAKQLSAGIIPVEKRPEAESKFRKEYSDQTAGYRDVKAAYGRVLSSQDNAVGDLSLIFGYMKMLDPGSVVREGEFATAQNAAGVPDRLVNIYNRVLRGERLNPAQRTAFKGQAETLFKQAGQQEAAVRTGLERIARGYGLNTENIFIEAVESVPTAPVAPAPAPRPGAPAGRPRNVTVDY